MSNDIHNQETIFCPDDIPLLADFVVEAGEHIESAESALLDLENNPEDNELLNQIFRAFHTVKGLAGFLGLAQIGSLAHSAENLLDLARKGQLSLVGENVDAIFSSIDLLKQMVANVNDAIENNTPLAPEQNAKELVDRLDQLSSGETNEPDAKDEKQAKTEKTEKVDEVKTDSDSDTEELAAKDEPETVSQEDTPVAQETEVENEPSEKTVEVSETEEKKAVAEVLPLEADEPKEAATEPVAQEAPAPQPQPAAQPQQNKTAASKAPKGRVVEEKIKVSTSRLDYLVNTVGELVIAQLMLSEEIYNNDCSDNNLVRKISHQGKIVRELQELSMSMRMVPIYEVFQKMNRLARDLSHKAGKNIKIDITGEETELDRTLVDKIADPLVHMVRNSVDHGIELPEDRNKNGKKETGTLSLRAFHQSGKIIIEVEDDGKGLDKERIIEKAINQGLIDKDHELSDEDIFKLIFHPGFSTAQKVTSISGRGVGMDVVKRNIEALRGKVAIESTLGKGTKFTIQLPLTLAIIDGQIITVGKERYIVPINSISYSFRPVGDQVFSVCDKGEMVMVQEELYPLIRLYEIFDLEPKSTNPYEALIVLVEDNNQKYCLLIDELLGQQQVVIKNLGDQMDETQGFTGGAIMGDGKVSLILDIPGLIELTKSRQLMGV